LIKLDELETEGLYRYSVVVVDNDKLESARSTVESHARISKNIVRYYLEKEQNIALARNKAIENADGEYVALIDDDEIPTREWLSNLYSTALQYKSDGVLGPVLPHFEEYPPKWVLKGKLFERPSHSTGNILEWEDTRTGNALLKKDIFRSGNEMFDPSFGSGGEDRDFFKRAIERGGIFVWCNEAPVYESIPPIRWKRTVLMKRALLRGKMALNNKKARPMSILRSAIAIGVYTVCMPVCFIMGQHVFMNYLIKYCDHLGKILAFLGINLVRENYVGGY